MQNLLRFKELQCLFETCMRQECRDDAYASRVLKAYRQFLATKKVGMPQAC